MAPFLEQARSHMIDTVKALASISKADLRFGVAGYREHSGLFFRRGFG